MALTSSQYCDSDLLGIDLVADILSVSKRTVFKWIESGKLVPHPGENGERPRFQWGSLRQFPVIREMVDSRWEEEQRIEPRRSYRAIELFAGGGGLALGLERAGFSSVLLNECDRDSCATLRRNRPAWNVLEGDIAKFDFREHMDIDFVSGGFPCQAFSYAGNKGGFADTRGTLFFEFARVINETRPRVFLGENVRGLLTHDNGRTIKTIRSVISELGYTLIDPHILKAIFFRVPQKRERLALVGIRNDLIPFSEFKWPSPAPRIYTLNDALKKGALYNCDVPPSPGQSYPKRKAEIISHVPPGGYWKDLPHELQIEYMKGSYRLDGGKTGLARRLSWDAPSLTLTCAPAQNQTERCHPEENRPLTIREYARIQTFPDNWHFAGNISSQYRQIGNAVPVNLAEALGRSLIALLNSIEKHIPKQKTGSKDDSRDIPSCFNYRRDEYVQMELQLCESKARIVEEIPSTLHGTYRKACRDWIASNLLYNYPLIECEGDQYQACNIQYLLLTRQNDPPMHFRVLCSSVVSANYLKSLNYPLRSRTPLGGKYILYKLAKISDV